MALQSARAYFFRGEDLGFAGGYPVERSARSTVSVSSRPTLVTLGFVGSIDVSRLVGAAAVPANGLAGKTRILVNRSARYWMSLTGQLGNGDTSGNTITATFPIPPRGMLFLPSTFFAGPTATVSANSTWPLPQLPGAPAPTPAPTTTASMAFDFYSE